MNARQRKKHSKFPCDHTETLYGLPVLRKPTGFDWTRVKQRVGQRMWRQWAGCKRWMSVTIGTSMTNLAKRHHLLRSQQSDPQQEFRWLRDALLRVAGGTRYARKRR